MIISGIVISVIGLVWLIISLFKRWSRWSVIVILLGVLIGLIGYTLLPSPIMVDKDSSTAVSKDKDSSKKKESSESIVTGEDMDSSESSSDTTESTEAIPSGTRSAEMDAQSAVVDKTNGYLDGNGWGSAVVESGRLEVYLSDSSDIDMDVLQEIVNTFHSYGDDANWSGVDLGVVFYDIDGYEIAQTDDVMMVEEVE